MHSERSPLVAITSGEPAGIGPDLCLLLSQKVLRTNFVIVGDKEVLLQRARLLGVKVTLVDFGAGSNTRQVGTLSVLHTPTLRPVTPGKLDRHNSRYVLTLLDIAVSACLNGTVDAMVTAPVHKAVINDAGFLFSGHTEYLAKATGTSHVVMMLVGGGLRVALATTHLALKDVPNAINRNDLENTIRILHRDMVKRFGVPNPRILVTGLNPHAGESGHLGNEEIETITPVIEHLRLAGFNIHGPLAADTLFTPSRLKDCDCILAMYHDQGLPVLKYASFGAGVNVTLGLPIIRTSVDHGTALDLAASGNIDCGSLIAAIELASELVKKNKALAS
jgi:4-hydroxythreonine-4-phosphate dehydrogenase